MVATNFVALANTGKVSSSAVDTAFAKAVDRAEDVAPLTSSPRAAVAAQVRSVGRLFSEWTGGDVINLKAYAPLTGPPAYGDNIHVDTAAVSAVFAEANARYLATGGAFPTSIIVPPGEYLIDGPLPALLGSTKIIAVGGPRSATFNFVPGSAGNAYDGITFKGVSSPSPVSCSLAGIDGLGLGSYGMAGGNQLVFDWCTYVAVRNVLSVGAYNFCSLRQVNTVVFEDVYAEGISGQYGIRAYGTETSRTGTSRNGAQDWVTLVNLSRTVLIGNNNPGFTVGTADLLLIDGAVQTVNLDTVIFLQGKRGIHTTNTPNVPNPLFCSFLWGQNIELETFYLEAMRVECANSMDFDGFYATGSQSSSGVYLGPNVNEGCFRGGRVQQHWAHGWLLDGAKQICIIGIFTWGNSQGGSGQADAIHIQAGADQIQIIGGLCGRRLNNPSVVGGSTQYTELQAFGIHNDGGGSNVVAGFVGLLGNATGTTSGTVNTTGCFTS